MITASALTIELYPKLYNEIIENKKLGENIDVVPEKLFLGLLN